MKDRKNRIIARGEHSNHCHVITGDAEVVRNGNGEIIVKVGEEGAMLRHLLETEWMKGNEVWTKEHHDITIAPGEYKYIAQEEYDPFDDIIREVRD